MTDGDGRYDIEGTRQLCLVEEVEFPYANKRE